MPAKKSLSAIMICLCICLGLFGQSDQNEKILRIAQELLTVGPEEITIKELGGGLTNDNFKVSSGSISYFFRSVNNANSFLGNSLEREYLITNCLCKASIAPKVIAYYPEEEVLITEFIQAIDGKVDLHDKATMLEFCHLIVSLHSLKVEFPTIFDPFVNIEDYVRSATKLAVDLPNDLKYILLPKISALQKITSPALNSPKVPSHLDLHAGNVLDDGNQLWLIDWEYAAMADPYFDLATLTSVENFSDQEMKMLLEYYLTRNPTDEEFNYFLSMRVLADTRWALWAYIQAKISPLDEPFEMLGEAYLEHALARINGD